MTRSILPARRKRLVALALVVAVLVAIASSASAGAFGNDKSEPQTSKAASVKKQLKKLTKRIVALEQKDSQPSGPAKGDLAGSYPNPTIAPNVVGPGKIPDETLTGYEIAPDSLHANDLASDSVGAAELKVTHTVVSNGVTVGTNATGTATAECPAGELLTGGGHSWLNNVSTRIVYSTPVEFGDARQWTVQGFSASPNTLYAWAVCLPG
jgi:hypothetical protein